ncbi:hypothetical protein PWG15_05275 [Ensifer adhaerens]|uniref:hypothetical protein n=1 Tax=Ensifer adhaerens TaxID=106592 RepID=UPI0023A95C64|nr:hypothetical protein [Ensifer adhaerens]WDZ77916.1 hypothetical protein PWG15_05275 [Ensifer adhaerens]
MTAFERPLSQLEDTILDLRALMKLVLFATEHSEHEDFGKLRETFNTTIYLMLEKLEVIDGQHSAMWTIETAIHRQKDTLQ